MFETENGIIDITGYSREEQEQFLIDNPDAVPVNAEPTVNLDEKPPESEMYNLIQDEVNKIEKARVARFERVKYGIYDVEMKRSIGGFGDKVPPITIFEDPKDHAMYLKWMKGEDYKPSKSFINQVDDMSKEYDLNLDPATSNSYYNKNKDNSFVEEFFADNDSNKINELEEFGFSVEGFQGFLNRNNLSDDFREDIEKGIFTPGFQIRDIFKVGSGGVAGLASAAQDKANDAVDLAVSKERVLATYMNLYMNDVHEKVNRRRFYEDYLLNPKNYEKYDDAEEAYADFLDTNNEVTLYDFDAFDNYYEKQFPLLVARQAENLNKQKNLSLERESEDDVTGFFKGAGETLYDGVAGFLEAGDDTITWLDDLILPGGSDRAEQKRLLDIESDYADPRKALTYMRVSGKSVDYNGKNYLRDRQGNIYDTTNNINVTKILTTEQAKNINALIDIKGVDDVDSSFRGYSTTGGHVIGNILFQILGTKGAGSARLASSTMLLRSVNKSRALLNMGKISTRARAATGRFVSTKGTFGVKLPFDARIIDASAFQAFYGATTGYENTIREAKKQGLTDSEAEKLANLAQTQMAVLYGITGPINPRLPMLNWVDDVLARNNLINKAISEYKKTGSKEAFKKSIGSSIKQILPNRKTLIGFIQEGSKEVIQENIQQSGEFFIVNRNVNEEAGFNLVKADYSLDDFISTSILSMAAGGLLGGASSAKFNFKSDPNARVANLYQLSRNIKSSKKLLDFAVKKGKITQTEANDILKQAEAVGKASNNTPAWMLQSPNSFIEYSMKKQEIDEIKRKRDKKDKQFHAKFNDQIKTLEQEMQEIADAASEEAIKKETDIVKKVVGEENVVVFDNVAQMIEAGFSDLTDLMSDGFLEKDGKIYINKQAAQATQAVSVASHELLHKVLKAEFKNNPEMKRIVKEFKAILKNKGVLDPIENRMKLYRKQGIDVDGKDADEYFTAFSDAIGKNEIPFQALEESNWVEIGRKILDLFRTRFGLKNAQFTSGRQVYDFIRDYQSNIKKGKITSQAKKKLADFTPDEERKSSISLVSKINSLVSEDVKTKEAYFDPKVFNPIYKETQPGGSIYNYVNSRSSSAQQAEKTLESIVDRLINFDPATGKSFAEFIFANTNFARLDANKALFEEGQRKTTSIDDSTKQIADTSTQTEQTVEGKKYTKIKDSGINPRTKEKTKASILRTVRTLKSGLTDAKSLNKKVSPIIGEILNSIGNSPAYDAIIKELGTRDDLRKNLIKFKQPVLENLTTTWLMRGIPQAIQKQVDGSFTSDWQGKKIDRETVGTDNAGRTSGHDIVRRIPNVNNSVTEDQYLSNFYDAKGKLIRGRKEALAKQMTQEYGLEILIDELQNNPNGEIAKAFDLNQESQGVINVLGQLSNIIDQSERGGVKRSITDPAIQQAISTAVILGLQGRETDLEIFFDNLPAKYKFIKDAYDQLAIDTQNLNGYIKPLKKYAETADPNIKVYIDEFLSMSKDEKIKSVTKFADKMIDIIPSNAFSGELGEAVLAMHYRVINPNSKEGAKLRAKMKSKSDLAILPFDPSLIRIMQGGTSASPLFGKIQRKILFKNFKSDADARKAFDEMFSEEVENANAHNLLALEYLVEQATDIAISDPSLIPGYLYWLQSNSDNGKALRGLTTLEDVQIFAENQAPFVGKADAQGNRQGYASITAANRKAFENGEIIVNRFHPVFKEAQDYMNKKGYELTEKQYQKRLRPKGEHKVPSANKMFEIAEHQLGIIALGLKHNNKKALGALKIANRTSLTDLLSNFSQQLGTEVLSAIQDEAHGITSSLGDLRMMAISEAQQKSFHPTQGNIQAFARAQRELKIYLDNIDINKIAEVNSQQQAIDNSRKRSYSVNPNGMSVYDFDDTLAFSDSKIIVTMPPNPEILDIAARRLFGKTAFKDVQDFQKTFDNLNEAQQKQVLEGVPGTTKKITPAEFAAQDEKLKAQGATFDFSEFNKVVKGRPGPLAPRLKKAIDKFGNKNIYVLTARPQASAKAIYNFLKGIGLEIPLKNITGLENGTPAAKAGWIVNKVAEGYNDFYFVDDAYKNVKAVQDVLNVFDVKGKVQQAIAGRKRSLSVDLNKMIERKTGIKAEATFSEVVARKKGAKKGKFKFFIPHSADDFRGLTSYTLAGKGKQGEIDQKFFEDNLVTPYTKGIAAMEHARQALKNDYRVLLKGNPEIKKNLSKKLDGIDFTLDQAIRVYLYSQSGYEIPGISKRDKAKLISIVSNNKDLKKFADTLQLISKKDAWVEPAEFWDVGSVLKDLNSMTEKVNRAEYLAEFIENVDTVFNKQNLNKLEAVYGTNYVSALKDIIRRMKSGVNRPAQAGKIEQAWLNWVNNSVGTIMFFNRRSALLQMISFTNFVNWSDNNPLSAATAFANQPEYWKAWSEIFNSDKLKQRRGGLKSDVQEQEIANQAKNSKDTAGAIISYLLKIGFTPTQIADSMAIATGGATLLINRTKTYQKQGMSYKQARAKAFEDFSKISDETQQSGDPMLISQQQSSHLGRLILAFQNTPMQYTRLMKKAGQDLINGRGSVTTNISKIMYYGFIQNVIFTSLQQALFALLPEFDPEDDDEKYQKLIDTKQERIINGMVDTILRGSGLAGAVVSTIKNTINRYYKEEKKGFTADHTYTLLELANVSPPIGSKLRKLYSALQTKKFDKNVIAEMGMDVTIDGRLNISPSYEILGNVVSAAFNLPLDRAIIELEAISEALDDRNTSYQRIALMLGWRTWDVNAKNEEQDVIKIIYKEIKKIKGKEKARKTREENKIKEQNRIKNMTEAERIEYYNEKNRKNAERARKAAETRRRNMSNN